MDHSIETADLPLLRGHSDAAPSSPRGAAFNDPAFASNKKTPVHRWVPWIAGFSQQFVRSGLEKYLHAKGTVLDPFAGVGTTLLESNLAGHNSIGFEINPYAAFASLTKLRAARTDPQRLRKETRRFLNFLSKAVKNSKQPSSCPPEGFRTRGVFYSPKVLYRVLLTQDFIKSIQDKNIADFFRLAFASTMVSYSNYSYEPSLGQKTSVGRPLVEEHPVEEDIAIKLNDIADDIAWMKKTLNGSKPTSKVINASFFDAYQKIKSCSVDLVITSPPYLNNYHYNRNTRPHLYWLGFASSTEDLRELEQKNFGKFWQTVREQEEIQLDPLIRSEKISKTLRTLRNKNRDKGIYGGAGWANYAAAYFNDCVRFAKGIKWCLRRKGTALVVIGNSILQGIPIPTEEFFGSIAEDVGLKLIDIHIPRNKRVGNSIIQSEVRVGKAKNGQKLYEAIVELRKK